MTNDNWKKSKEINDKVSGIVAKMLECTDKDEWNALKKELTAGFTAGKNIHKPQFFDSWKDGICRKLERYHKKTFQQPQQEQKSTWKKGQNRQYNTYNNNGLQEIAAAINRLADAIEKLTTPSNNK